MDLESYRREAEGFLTAFNREYLRHFAGHQPEYALEAIYDRYATLFEREAVLTLREAASTATGEEHRRVLMLLAFAVEGYAGAATKTTEAELAQREARLTLSIDGEALAYRGAVARQANEADPQLRAVIDRERLSALESELGALCRELVERQHAAAAELGWATYADMCAETQGLDLNALGGRVDGFLHATADAYLPRLEAHVQRSLGVRLAGLHHSDLPRLFRAPEYDPDLPADELVSSYAATLAGLGIDLHRQAGLSLDVEARPGKSPRAFCAPVRTPQEVHLVIAPIGGRDDFEALFHEGGHAQHASHVDATLAFEYRCLGDNAISESYAFLMQHLIDDPAWLQARLGVPAPEPLIEGARVQRLLWVRRYCAKLLYELHLHGPGGGPGAATAQRYAQGLTEAVGVTWPTASYLSDVDSGFYSAAYLRAWALEAQLRTHLCERFGSEWFAEPAAGRELAGLWGRGQRDRPEELLADLTGASLNFDALAADLMH
jgi:hypothetical protein